MPSYKLSSLETDLLEHEVKKWQQLGVVEKSDNIRFMSPVLLTSKTDGSSRLLCDLRLLNASIIQDRYMFASIEDLLRKLGEIQDGEETFYAVLDLKNSFFQIRLDEESKKLVGFSLGPGRSYRFARCPQGLSSSPTSLARLQERVFGSLDFVLRYADDFLVYGKSVEQLIDRLRQVFELAGKDNIRFALDKCNL